MQRSLLIFENSIKSEATRTTYLWHLDRFMKFNKIDGYDNLAQMKANELQIMVEDYVMYLKKKISPNTINLPIAAIKAFLECNDIDLRWNKIKRLQPARVKATGKEAWLTSEVNTMLSFAKDIRTKTLLHFLASTGMRIGGFDELKIKHIHQIEDCKSVLIYEGSTEEYITFLTPEASEMFDKYIKKRETDGEKMTPESPAFRSSYQLGYATVKPSNSNALKELVRVTILHSGLRINQIRTGNRYNKQADHAFRKRFNTIMKTTPNMNISLIEKMMGHSTIVRMDNVYLDPTIEQLFQEFKKAISELTIDDSQRLKFKNEQLEKEKSELEIERAKHDKLEKDFHNFKDEMKTFLKKINEKQDD